MKSRYEGLSVGAKIIKACGGDEERIEDESAIVQGLRETIDMLNSCSFCPKKKLKDSCLVNSLYFSLEKELSDKQKRMYRRATTQVIREFLEWLLNVPALQGQLHKKKELLKTFVFDLGALKLLEENFFNPFCGRSKTNHTYFHFYDSRNALFLNYPLPFETQEFLSVFGLRQAMEIKFRRIIGLEKITPPIKMRHDVIPSIISDNEDVIYFSKEKKVTIKEILHIYQWTNLSIHYMISVYPWLIWKAFEVCSVIFNVNNDGPANAIGFDSSIQFSVDTLKKMRNRLIDEVQRISDESKQSYDIIWSTPEAFVFGDNNNVISFNDSTVNVKTTISPK